jgi:Domain of unknown function (DUF927)
VEKNNMKTKENKPVNENNDRTARRLIWLANIDDQAKGRGYDRFRIHKLNGEKATMSLPREVSAQPFQLYSKLMAANAAFPSYHEGGRELIKTVLKGGPRKHRSAASATGWNENHLLFVDHHWVIGENRSGKGRLIPPINCKSPHIQFKTKGDLKSWIREIGSSAKSSSVIQFALATAFAAPLLAIKGWPPFLICLHGPSKSGKTTALLAAASVIGFGDESCLPKFNATRAAMMERATWFRDILLPIDETAAARDATGFATDLKSFIYGLSGGRDDARHSSFGINGVSGSGQIRTIALITSESSWRTMSATAGRRAQDGSDARAYDVAVLSDGCSTIFDRPPAGASDANSWAERRSRKLRISCQQQHGTALRAYIEHLLQLGPEAAKQKIEALVKEFKAPISRRLDDRIVQHAAESFGLIYAGGVLGIEAGLLPVKRKTLLRTLTRTFVTSLEHIRSEEDLEQEGMAKLKTRLDGSEWPNRKSADKRTCEPEFVGFTKKMGGHRHFFAKRQWLEQNLQSSDGTGLLVPVLRALYRAKLLIIRAGQDPLRSGFTAKSTETFFKLNRKQHRWVQFIDPRTPRPRRVN